MRPLLRLLPVIAVAPTLCHCATAPDAPAAPAPPARWEDACAQAGPDGRTALAERLRDAGLVKVTERALDVDEVAAQAGLSPTVYGVDLVLTETVLEVIEPAAQGAQASLVWTPSAPLPSAPWFAVAEPPPEKPLLPPPPYLDAPRWRPTFHEEMNRLVGGAVALVVDTALLPAGIAASMLPGPPYRPFQIFQRVTDTPARTMFDDGLLDPEVYQAEVGDRARTYLTALARHNARQQSADEAAARVDALATLLACTATGPAPCRHLRVRPRIARDRHVVDLAFPNGCRVALSMDIAVPLPPPRAMAPPPRPAPAPPDRVGRMRQGWTDADHAAPGFVVGAHRGTPQSAAPVSGRARTVEQLDDVPLQCRLRVAGGNWDAFGGRPDLSVRFTAGRTDAAGRTLVLDDNRLTGTLTIEHVHLAPGDIVKLAAIDRDILEHDWVGSARATFDGTLPLRFEHPRFTARCHILDDDKDRLASIRHQAQRTLRAFERSCRAVDLRSHTLGVDPQSRRGAIVAIEEHAARTGWAATQPYSDRVDAAEAQFAEKVAAAHRDLASHPPTPRLGTFAVDRAEVDCQAYRCALTVRLRATKATSLDLTRSPSFVDALAVVDDTGDNVALPPFPHFRQGDKTLAAEPHALARGDVVDVTWSVRELWTGPHLLRVGRARKGHWVAIVRPVPPS